MDATPAPAIGSSNNVRPLLEFPTLINQLWSHSVATQRQSVTWAFTWDVINLNADGKTLVSDYLAICYYSALLRRYLASERALLVWLLNAGFGYSALLELSYVFALLKEDGRDGQEERRRRGLARVPHSSRLLHSAGADRKAISFNSLRCCFISRCLKIIFVVGGSQRKEKRGRGRGGGGGGEEHTPPCAASAIADECGWLRRAWRFFCLCVFFGSKRFFLFIRLTLPRDE